MTPTQPVVLGSENDQLIQIIPSPGLVTSGSGRDVPGSSGSVIGIRQSSCFANHP